MERNILLKIEYDGTHFSGWQRQPERRTVQGELEKALSRLCAQEIRIDGTSRTDAGVHALGQCATFHGEFGIPTDRIARAVNDHFSRIGKDGDLRIVSAEERPMGFHARFDAKGKKYRYMIRCGAGMPVFLSDYRYHVRDQLDTAAMKRAAAQIVGTHDFACFQAAGGEERETTVRTVYRVELTERCLEEGFFPEEEGAHVLDIDVTGDGFLYNMVRIMAGTLVDVGSGRIGAADVPAIIESADREKAGHTAPPQGLYLMRVYFEEDFGYGEE
jgi:tRNA pseudouridine38-40 synthase